MIHINLRSIMLAAVLFSCRPSLTAATIILVRHAERSSAMSSDVPLSAAGEERAKALAQMLRDAGIEHIFVTQLRRTQQTAAPLAAQLHLKPVVIAEQDTDALLRRLRALGENETALVVGHSETVPLIVEQLSGEKMAPMGDGEYDRLIVLVTGKSQAAVVRLRYGKATE